MSLFGILTGKHIVSNKQLDSFYTSSGQYQVGCSRSIPSSTISTGLPTFGEKYFPSYYPPNARGKPMVTHFDNTLLFFGQPNVEMNVCQWPPTLPIQPQMVVHSYQPIQTFSPTSIPLVNSYLPLLQTQNVVPKPS